MSQDKPPGTSGFPAVAAVYTQPPLPSRRPKNIQRIPNLSQESSYIFVLVPVQSISTMLQHPLALNTLVEGGAVALDGSVRAWITSPQHHLVQIFHCVFFFFIFYLHASQLTLCPVRPITSIGINQYIKCVSLPFRMFLPVLVLVPEQAAGTSLKLKLPSLASEILLAVSRVWISLSLPTSRGCAVAWR